MRQYDRYGWKGENMGKKEGQGENRISGIGVRARLIGITMIPIISILIILTFISAKDMRQHAYDPVPGNGRNGGKRAVCLQYRISGRF